jgi:hypothetical protein
MSNCSIMICMAIIASKNSTRKGERCRKENNQQSLLKSAYFQELRAIFDYPRFDHNSLSSNPSITYDIVSMSPMLPWNYQCLSFNPSITYRDVLSDPKKPWDYRRLSRNPSITYKDVLGNPDKPWHYPSLFDKNPVADR